MTNNKGAGVANKPATTSPTATTAPTTTTAGKTTKPDATALRAMTEKLAYELWEKRGKNHGNEMHDWLEAEKIARQKLGG